MRNTTYTPESFTIVVKCPTGLLIFEEATRADWERLSEGDEVIVTHRTMHRKTWAGSTGEMIGHKVTRIQ